MTVRQARRSAVLLRVSSIGSSLANQKLSKRTHKGGRLERIEIAAKRFYSATSDSSSSSRKTGGPAARNAIREHYQQNEKAILKRIQMSHDMKSGSPIYNLCTKWAAKRRPLSTSDVVELLHAAGRFRVRFSSKHFLYLTHCIQASVAGLKRERSVGKALYPLYQQRYTSAVRTFIQALVPKIAKCTEPYSERTFIAFQGMRNLGTSPATNSLVQLLASKIQESEHEQCTGRALNMMVYGVQRMDASEATMVYLRAVAEKLQLLEAEENVSIEDLSYGFCGLYRLSHTESGSNVLRCLTSRFEQSSEQLDAASTSRILSGLRFPPPQQVSTDSEIVRIANSETDKALHSLAASIEENPLALDPQSCEQLLQSLPILGEGQGLQRLVDATTQW
eukprot:CAMPEP_0184485966 /NCGR_PEP_ID=MMETSP0113_2-20130426/7529_1 /TAXON_ID=91329 /ORGANISM="Norrisiella sphaerica, Strain BC52" /LENGTH=391 /DNA_ID=CAMNT_0026867645 /DNA_START=146 /DNA_END=1318 /DNA_ORIENTATION=-